MGVQGGTAILRPQTAKCEPSALRGGARQRADNWPGLIDAQIAIAGEVVTPRARNSPY